MSELTNWKCTKAKNYYKKCIKLFGNPTFVANVKDGYVLWKTRGLFTKHLLIDENIKHCVPRPHSDYFYSSVKFFVPKNKIFDVLKISGSLNYDGLKKELTARCGHINANYSTIYLGMLIVNGDLTISEIKKKDMYSKMIMGDIIHHSKMAKEMMKLKRKNNKKYAKKIKQDFADYAFDKCHKSFSS
jgi:hypothetical protein